MPSTDLVSNVWSRDHTEESGDSGGSGSNNSSKSSSLVVGLDLGTSNSCMAVWHLDKNIVKVFKSKAGKRTTRSVVRWDAGSDPRGDPTHVGEAAAAASSSSSSSSSSCTVRCVKRIIGQRWDSPNVQALLPSLPFHCVPLESSNNGGGGDGGGGDKEEEEEGVDDVGGVESGENEVPMAGVEVTVTAAATTTASTTETRMVRTATRSPVSVSAMVVRELREQAEAYLNRPDHRTFTLMKQAAYNGGSGGGAGSAAATTSGAASGGGVRLTKCVVGVPVYFTEPQRKATRAACHEAGFEQVSLMAESTVAAVAYGLFLVGSKRVVVFDCGGGTTDVTLLSIDEGKFEVLATAGDNRLGGEDMDTALTSLVLRKHDNAAKKATAAIAGVIDVSASGVCEESDNNNKTNISTNASVDDPRLSNSSLRAACNVARVKLSDAKLANSDVVSVKCRIGRGAGGQSSTGSNSNSSGGNSSGTKTVDGKEKEEEEVVVDVEVTLGEYEAEVAPLVLKAQKLVEAVLDAAAEAAAARGEHGTKENDVDGDGDKTAVDAAADADAAAAAAAPLSGSSSSSSYHTMMVDEVVLVGGASRTPCLRAMLKSVFPHLKDLCTSSDADTSVAEGLAIRGAVASLAVKPDALSRFLMTDLLPLDLGVECFDDDDDSEDHDYGSDDDDDDEDDDNGGGNGAGKAARDEQQHYTKGEGEEGALQGRGRGRVDVVLPRLTRLPATNTRVFRCADPNQGGVTVDVYEGPHHDRARKNDKVASFTFLLHKRQQQDGGGRSSLKKEEEKEDKEVESVREILVRFTMTEGGELRVSMLDDDYTATTASGIDGNGGTALARNGNGAGNGEGGAPPLSREEKILTAAVAVLALLYLLLRLAVRPVFEHGDALVGSGAHEIRAAVASFGTQALGGGSDGSEEEGSGERESIGRTLGVSGNGGVAVSGASEVEL